MQQWFSDQNSWTVGITKSAVIIAVYIFVRVFAAKTIVLATRKFLGKVSDSLSQADPFLLQKLLRRVLLLLTVYGVVDSLPIPTKYERGLTNGILVLTTFVVLLFVFDLIDMVGRHVVKAEAREFQPLLEKIAKILAMTFAVMFILRVFNYDIWHIMTALGIGSLAVGLAAQPTLTNMIAGFTLLIDRPFRPRDRIKLSSGDIGDVLQIGMRSTRIHTTDGNLLIVPNSELVNTRVINFNFPMNQIGAAVKFRFDFEIDLQKVKECMLAVTQKVQGVETASVHASGIVDSNVEVTVGFMVDHFTNVPMITDRVIEACLDCVRENKFRLAKPMGAFAAPAPRDS